MDRCATFISMKHKEVGEVKVKQGEEELPEGADPTARWVWDAATPFAEWLCENKKCVEGKRVVEIGAGTGLVGIAAALLGAESVVLTDLPSELPLLQENADLNSAPNTTVAPCEWGNKSHLSSLGTFDVILVSDCLYGRDDDTISLLLLDTLIALSHPTTHVYLAYCYRENLIMDLSFFETAEETYNSTQHALPRNKIRQGVQPEDLWLLEYTIRA
eukprot:TRINITY_DN823_c5_g1_i1.p1 TRINITY_DN823_c5_g1~~TRINITY_DN823_c5_g1_i1.p1  ORF type:complete len:216 (+),score=35.60 TRINITY_DN823_c5_g1_i1:53-700(+)